ncbi:MAG: YniB family protein [Candidatus Malihini olakiniferum]
MIDVIQFNTFFINIFCYNSPMLDFSRLFSAAHLL